MGKPKCGCGALATKQITIRRIVNHKPVITKMFRCESHIKTSEQLAREQKAKSLRDKVTEDANLLQEKRY